MTVRKGINGYVTWPSLLLTIFTLTALAGGLAAYTLSQFEKRMDAQLEHSKDRLDKIDKHLEKK